MKTNFRKSNPVTAAALSALALSLVVVAGAPDAFAKGEAKKGAAANTTRQIIVVAAKPAKPAAKPRH